MGDEAVRGDRNHLRAAGAFDEQHHAHLLATGELQGSDQAAFGMGGVYLKPLARARNQPSVGGVVIVVDANIKAGPIDRTAAEADKNNGLVDARNRSDKCAVVGRVVDGGPGAGKAGNYRVVVDKCSGGDRVRNQGVGEVFDLQVRDAG